jgi:hypothetical protein
MATFTKFNTFIEAVFEKKIDCAADTFKFALTNTLPQATQSDFDPVTNHAAPAAANGYTTGGHSATIASSGQSGGTYTLASTTDVVITATAGGIGPFRYVVLYDDTATNDQLVSWWDYGSSITLANGETFTIDVTASLFTAA